MWQPGALSEPRMSGDEVDVGRRAPGTSGRRVANRPADRYRMERLGLCNTKQVGTQRAERRSLPLQPVDLFPDRRRQRRSRRVPAELAEHVLEMKLGLGRDFPALPFPVELGDELADDSHLPP